MWWAQQPLAMIVCMSLLQQLSFSLGFLSSKVLEFLLKHL